MNRRCYSCLEELHGGDDFLHTTCRKNLFGTKKISLRLKYLRTDIIATARERAARMSLGGAQPKVTLDILGGELTYSASGGHYILKPTTDMHPYISENEHLCLNIARKLDLSVPAFTLVELADGEFAFLSKRFDRQKKEKIHLEDFASVLNLPAEKKYEGSYLQVGKAVAQHCRDSGYEVFNMLKIVVLSYLIGNNDLHLKNFSLLDKGAHYELSPFYDLVCAERYYKETDMALELFDDFSSTRDSLGFYTQKDFLNLGVMLGLDEKAVHNLIAGLLDAREAIFEMIGNSFLITSEKKQIKEIVVDRYKRFVAAS